jgi:hypothetical protein
MVEVQLNALLVQKDLLSCWLNLCGARRGERAKEAGGVGQKGAWAVGRCNVFGIVPQTLLGTLLLTGSNRLWWFGSA